MLLKKAQIDPKRVNASAETLVDAVRARYPLKEEQAYRIRLVVNELSANILAYSDARDILLSASLEKDRLTIRIEDDGSGFSHERLMRRDCTDRAHLMEENGRGIFLVRKMADEVSFNDKGNVVDVTLDLA